LFASKYFSGEAVCIAMRRRTNWLIDLTIFVSAVSVGLTGFFMFIPSGGYGDGSNQGLYDDNKIVLVGDSWADIHLLGSVVMILSVTLHLSVHRRWIVSMTKRIFRVTEIGESTLSDGVKFSVAINTVIGISFLIAALSGLFFMLLNEIGFQGGNYMNWNNTPLFSRFGWTMLHVWSASVMTFMAVLHIVVHWNWVKRVAVHLFLSLLA
jgi:hypothetical protein